ncbi:hypothetical protein V1264_006173 [Littorina saxatilis]|uniref:Uncharacterized protein n=1 Tax=Littorina saxatilis TaxID=31220 RepID=A0AAN9AWQ1_9CAEN
MSVFSRRSSGYQAGVTLLFFSAFAVLVGFATPSWRFDAPYSDNNGLWHKCDKGRGNCVDLLHTTRALAALSLIGLFTACVYAIASNCCRSSVPGPVTRILEALSAVSGVLGFICCLVYIGVPEKKEYISWSFYLSIIGSAFCVVAAIIIGVWNKPLGRSNGFQVITLATISQDQGYNTPGGQAQAQPYGNAQSHGGHQSYGNDQPYENPQADGNAQPYGNPQPYENPPTCSSLQLNNQADQTGQGHSSL